MLLNTRRCGTSQTVGQPFPRFVLELCALALHGKHARHSVHAKAAKPLTHFAPRGQSPDFSPIKAAQRPHKAQRYTVSCILVLHMDLAVCLYRFASACASESSAARRSPLAPARPPYRKGLESALIYALVCALVCALCRHAAMPSSGKKRCKYHCAFACGISCAASCLASRSPLPPLPCLLPSRSQ